jgi:hypothetical protein
LNRGKSVFPILPTRASALHAGNSQTVKLWEVMPGNHRGQTVTVSASLMAELHTAQDVIDVVKETICGGNLKSNFMLTSGDSYHRSMAARHIRELDYRGDNNGLAKSAVAAGAGACSEHSELTMAYLSNMDLSRPVFTYANANGPDHRFNVIGDLREPKTAVVVDAWPSFAKAHLLDNAAFQPDGSRMMDVHLPGTPAKIDITAMAEIEHLSQERITQISKANNIPSYDEILNRPRDIGLRDRHHGINNLGVRYQNEDSPGDIIENTVSRHDYERQAHGAQLAQEHLAPIDNRERGR